MEANIPQEKAIKTIDENVAVNAGAGTGKTKVLTERFIEILNNGDLEESKEVEGIVAITFTKKASQEMVDRIRGEIRNNFEEDPKWSRFYRDMEKSNISTIHSFCANILRENPIEARIDPIFEVLEDYTSTKLLKESIEEVLLKELKYNENVYEILRILKKNTLDGLTDDIYGVYNMIRTVGLSFEETKSISLNYLDQLKVEDKDLETIKDTLLYLIDQFAKNTKLYKLNDDPIWLKFLNEEYDKDELSEILEHIYNNLGKSSKEPEQMELLTSTLEKAMLSSERLNLWIYETILNLIIEIDQLYNQKKKEVKGLDYDDLQIKTSNLLDDEWIRRKYQNKYKYIMVDEYQDTNELQKDIIYKLVSKDSKLDRSNLFIVGDPKQSIYGFRGADIDVFYEVVEDIEKQSKEKTITLEKNYRTVGTVLQFINNIFGKLMKDKYDSLSEFWESENEIDVELLDKPDLEIPEGESKSNYHRHYEADLIAKRIKQLVETGEYGYGDFAMLFRATTRNYIYEEALKNFGIPYYNTGGKGFFDQQEVKDLINALKSISNPFDDIATIGFLRSPMIGLKDTSIYWILRDKSSTIYNSMIKAVDSKNLEQNEKEILKKTINLFEELYQIKNLYGLSEVVSEIIKKTYITQSLLLTQGGKQAIANIYKFSDISKDYGKTNNGTIEDFIDYIEESRDRDESQGKIESEGANVVKILTIHKSKGLQFPVVIIPEMSTRGGGRYSNILFDKKIGIGLKLDSSKALHDKIKKDLVEKDKEESERVLYVAMTRAEKMLILGSQGGNQGFKQLIGSIINPEECTTISNIEMEAEGYTKVKLIDKELLAYKEKGRKDIPLLYDIPDYNRKKVERYSVSQYLAFRDCNRSFYMDYYKKISGEVEGIVEYDDLDENLEEKIEENKAEEKKKTQEENKIEKKQEKSLISPVEKGNIIHKFCEEYNHSKDIEELIQDISKSFGVEYSEELGKEFKPYIDNYLKQYDEDQDKVYIEKDFYLKIGDSFITGIIDRINIKDNKVEIIDYKTNKVRNKAKLIDQYRPQLQLYAYAVKEIIGLDVKRARISFLENGEYEDVPIDEKSLKENLLNIEEFMNFVSANNNIKDYKPSEKCNDYCKHKLICSLEEED